GRLMDESGTTVHAVASPQLVQNPLQPRDRPPGSRLDAAALVPDPAQPFAVRLREMVVEPVRDRIHQLTPMLRMPQSDDVPDLVHHDLAPGGRPLLGESAPQGLGAIQDHTPPDDLSWAVVEADGPPSASSGGATAQIVALLRRSPGDGDVPSGERRTPCFVLGPSLELEA